METVSETFKKAIKATEREVKGYVEVIFDNQDGSGYQLTTAPERLRNSLDTEIVDGIKKNKKYASLEENYTELDGSFLLPNYNIIGDKTGYVSNEIFSNIENRTITLSKESDFVTSSGITIYFENNIAQRFTLTITNSDDESITLEAENDKSVYQHIFENPISIKSININIQQMEYSNRRIRISEIDFGISQVYEGSDLVSFTTNEEIDLLFTSTPINTCTVNLNNYDNSFNPLNPTGLVKYLTDNCIMKPYIGVLTEENGIEYVPMGYFYLKDWSSDNDGNVTLNGQSLMGILANLELKTDGNFLSNSYTPNQAMKYFTNMYGYSFAFTYGSIDPTYTKQTKLLDYLQEEYSSLCLVHDYAFPDYVMALYIDRNNTFREDSFSKKNVETLSRNDLLDEPKDEVISGIKEVDITSYSYTYSIDQKNTQVLNVEHTLTKNVEYIWYKLNKKTINGVFSYTSEKNGKATLIDNNECLLFVKIEGEIGEKIIISYTGDTKNITYMKYNQSNSLKIGDVYEYKIDGYLSPNARKYMIEGIYNNNHNHKMDINYIGDPSLIPGDSILIETMFGNKNIIITKQKLTFDGGLSGNIEGVGNYAKNEKK